MPVQHDRLQLLQNRGTHIQERGAAGTVRAKLADHRINVSVAPLPSSEVNAILAGKPCAAPSVVRASVHYYNTEAEIQRLVHLLR